MKLTHNEITILLAIGLVVILLLVPTRILFNIQFRQKKIGKTESEKLEEEAIKKHFEQSEVVLFEEEGIGYATTRYQQ